MDLREWRRSHRITQAQIAALAGIDRSSLTRYEHGDCDPSLSVVRALVRASEALVPGGGIRACEIVGAPCADLPADRIPRDVSESHAGSVATADCAA